MSDGFIELIRDANAFNAELAANNRRDWFEPRKETYAETIKRPAELLGQTFADSLSRLTGQTHSAKLFRIHRDVRFSKDKTPYNAHLHLIWRQSGDMAPAWFFGASPNYVVLGTGVMGFSGPALGRFRAFVDREGTALSGAISTAKDEVAATLSDWGPAPLKRVPKPYAPDHPQADLLRRKALAISANVDIDAAPDGLIAKLEATAHGLLPIWTLLNREFG